MTETKRRQQRGRRRMEQILDAAAELFSEIGFEAATTNGIAARADISPGSLYQFFTNKEAIAEALVDRYLEQLRATHDVALDPQVAELSLDEMIDRIVDPLNDFYVANPSAHALMHGADFSRRLAATTQQLHEAVLERIEAIIALRAPALRRRDRRRSAEVSVQIFKAVLPMVMAAKPSERSAVVSELKSALRGYLGSLERPVM